MTVLGTVRTEPVAAHLVRTPSCCTTRLGRSDPIATPTDDGGPMRLEIIGNLAVMLDNSGTAVEHPGLHRRYQGHATIPHRSVISAYADILRGDFLGFAFFAAAGLRFACAVFSPHFMPSSFSPSGSRKNTA